MPHDPFAWLGKIEPEKPRNARLWPNAKGVVEAGHAPLPGEQPEPDAGFKEFVNLAEERSAKRRARARKGVTTRRANALAKLLNQNTAPPETPPMPKANLNAPTPGNLRTYLLQHGPTDRVTLLDAVGFRRSYKNEATARTMLNKALKTIGATSDTPRGPLRIDQPYDDPQKTNARVLASLGIGENEAGPPKPPDRDEKPVTRAPYTSLTPRQERLRSLILKARARGGAAEANDIDGDYVGGANNPEFAADLAVIGAVQVGPGSFTIDLAPAPKAALNAFAERASAELQPGIDELLEEFAEASIDLDKAIDRHAKARAAVLAAATTTRDGTRHET